MLIFFEIRYNPRMAPTVAELTPLHRLSVTTAAADFGFRFGDRGTHTSRTLMLEELETVLANK